MSTTPTRPLTAVVSNNVVIINVDIPESEYKSYAVSVPVRESNSDGTMVRVLLSEYEISLTPFYMLRLWLLILRKKILVKIRNVKLTQEVVVKWIRKRKLPRLVTAQSSVYHHVYLL
jgi:hypothetical protein